jgi:hypothetical protein
MSYSLSVKTENVVDSRNNLADNNEYNDDFANENTGNVSNNEE